MTDKEFLARVRERGGLLDDRSALAVSEAVVRHLVGRLAYGEKQELAALLPPRLRRTAVAAPNTGLAYAPAGAFVRDLADDLGLSRGEARRLAGVVGAVLAELGWRRGVVVA